jgi:hypothetical protein
MPFQNCIKKFSSVGTKCEKTVNLKSVNVRKTVKSKSVKQFPDRKKLGPTGIRTQVARIRTLSDNQLHYGTEALW